MANPLSLLAEAALAEGRTAGKTAMLKAVLKKTAKGDPFKELEDVLNEAKSAIPKRAAPGPRQQVDDTLGNIDNPDVMFEGVSPSEFRAGQWGRFGEHYGVKGLGPTSTKEWEKTLRSFKDREGNTYVTPGGLESREPYTYWDMLHLQSQGINPNKLTEAQHKVLHDRITGGHTVFKGQNPDAEKFNDLLLGLTSPNNPLTPNLLLMGRGMVKGPEDIARWARMGANNPAAGMSKKEKYAGPVRDITESLGVQAQSRGGLGVGGSHDYTMFPEFARKFQKDPQWFRFRGDLEHGADEAEKWSSYVERLMAQVKGLSAKTGSFGGVWQSPRDAAISAVDRHMLDIVGDGIFATPEEAAKWHAKVIGDWNKAKGLSGDAAVKSLDEILASGGKKFVNDRQFAIVNAHKAIKFRDTKGNIRKEVPDYLRNEDWIEEPAYVHTISPGYKRGVAHNQRHAKETGQTGLFASQWLQWDRKRNRIDAHLGIFPALAALPRMSMAQMRMVRDVYKKAGYFNMAEKKAAEKGELAVRTIPPISPVSNPSRLAYFTGPLAALGLGGLMRKRGGNDA